MRLKNGHIIVSNQLVIEILKPNLDLISFLGSIRQDNSLYGQARLINQFADKEIWDNVIIVCKLVCLPYCRHELWVFQRYLP